MIYSVEVKEEVEEDLKKLTKAQRILVYKQFKKLQTSPELGQPLGNKAGYDLRGCRKLYVDKKRIRIVYRIEEARVVVEVVAVGKREEMEVYKTAEKRL
ncbi:type II toxin-antitoxin system mRNA interferase toxin, RelE/StbE family [Hydrogenimonas sp.]